MPPRLKLRFAALLLMCSACASLAAAPLRVGIDTDGEPMTFIDAKGVPAGFAVELMNAIAQEMHFEVVYVAKPWPEMFADFQAGRTDALANITSTPERAAIVEFSDPHCVMNAAIFVRKGGATVKSPLDLAGLRVAAKPGGAPHVYLQAHGWAQHIVPTATLRDSLRAVATDRADAALDARIMGLKNIRDEHLTNVEAVDVELLDYAQRLHVGLQRGDTAHLALINDGLARLHASDTYDRIYEKWIGHLDPRQHRLRDLQPYLVPLVVLAAAVLGALFWQRRLLQRLSRQTEALRLSEERLTLVLEGSEDGFWDWEIPSGRFTRSERWARMLGYELTEIPPTLEGSMQLVHPDDLASYNSWQARFYAQISHGNETTYRMKSKSGEWRWILDRGKVVARAPDGTPLRMTGTHTDITERKRIEQALLENRELLARSAHLLEQTQAVAHIGGWEVDVVTRRCYWTEETHRLHETDPAAYQPTIESALAFYLPESRELVLAAVEKAIRDGTPYDLEVSLRTQKGRLISVHTTGRVERRAGQAVKLYGSFRDVTAEKAAEQEKKNIQLKMLETQKLESLGVLAGGIAHDFNNLLTVILSNASLARQDDPTNDYLAPIETAALRAADLCRQMLAYAGHDNLVIEQTDLGRLVQETTRLLEVSISKKAILTQSLAPKLPAVEGDPSQLQQVVMNLVINASESLGDSPGEIRVTTRLGRPETEPADAVHSFDIPPGECVCLEVSDTGGGMSKATIARVFDPFFTTKFTGRGLGLAATLGIVRTHRGALTVQSDVGRGTTFRLFLPAAKLQPDAGTAPVAEASPPPSATTLTLLVVDDEPAVLAAADLLLRHHGYATVLATDGLEAVSAYRKTPDNFAGIVLDLTMPGLDGAEVVREIRALRPAARVLVMSGFSEQDVLRRLRGLTDVTLLQKPFTLETMLGKIRQMLSQ